MERPEEALLCKRRNGTLGEEEIRTRAKLAEPDRSGPPKGCFTSSFVYTSVQKTKHKGGL